jgi:hypothetical protein
MILTQLFETALKDKADLQAKRKTLQDLSMNKDVDQKAVQQRKLDLEKEAKRKGLAESAEGLNIGDPVEITGNVEFNGATGEIAGFGSDNRFVIVNLYNHGKHSFHSSDVSYNDYADAQDEEDDWYDDQEDTLESFIRDGADWEDALRELNVFNDVFLSPDIQDTHEYTRDPEWQDLSKMIRNSAKVQEIYGQLKKFANLGVKLTSPEVKRLDSLVWDGGGDMDIDRLKDLYAHQLGAVEALLKTRAQNNTKSGQTIHEQGVAEGQSDVAKQIHDLNFDMLALLDAAKTASPKEKIILKQKFQAAKQKRNKLLGGTLADSPVGKLGEATSDEVEITSDDQTETYRYKGWQFKETANDYYSGEAWLVDPDGNKEWFGYQTDDKRGLRKYYDDQNNLAFSLSARDEGQSTEKWLKAQASDWQDTWNAQPNAPVVHEQDVAEAQTDYQKRRQRERDVDAGKPVSRQPKNPQTDYAKKRAEQRRQEELGEGDISQLEKDIADAPVEPIANMEEAKGLKKRVRIVKGSEAGKTGTVGEVRHGAFKGAPKTFTVDIDGGGSIQLPKEALRLLKDQGVAEMDKSQKSPAGWNLDDYDYSKGKWTRGKIVTAKDAVKDMSKELNRAFNNTDPKKKKQGVAEGGFGRDEEFRNRERNAGLEHETNNIQIAINGKPWKVVPGKGYADSAEERSYLEGMKRWAEKKSASTGKKWSVYLTGANPTVNELSTEKLAQYKKAAGADASAADKAGNIERGNRRFSGIVKATIKQGEQDAKKHRSRPLKEDSSPVENAILHRIMMAHPDVLAKYGPQAVMDAANDTADFVGDVDEIGTSDVSAWVKQTIQILDSNHQVDEVSKATLGRYVKLAGVDTADRASSSSYKSGAAGDKYNKADPSRQEHNRERGIDRAITRLTR